MLAHSLQRNTGSTGRYPTLREKRWLKSVKSETRFWQGSGNSYPRRFSGIGFVSTITRAAMLPFVLIQALLGFVRCLSRREDGSPSIRVVLVGGRLREFVDGPQV